MSKETIPSSSQSLLEVQQQFEQWRKTRKSRKPIPEHLWQAAAGLAKQYSINHVARLLRLNHTTLKENDLNNLPVPDLLSFLISLLSLII